MESIVTFRPWPGFVSSSHVYMYRHYFQETPIPNRVSLPQFVAYNAGVNLKNVFQKL